MPSSKKSSASTRTASKAPKPTKVVAQPPFDLAPDRPPDWFGWLLLALVLLTVIGLACVVWAADVTLSWQANTEPDLAGYKLYQSTTSGQYAAPVATLGNVTTHTVTVPTPPADSTYYFTLSAYDLAGNESGKSNEVSRLVAGVPVAPTLPPPTNFRYEAGAMKWDAMPQATGGYYLRVHEIGTPYSPCDATLYCNNGVNSLTATSKTLTFKPGTQYDAWIHSVAADGTVGTSTGIAFTTAVAPVDLPPANPKGLQITSATAEKIVLLASAADCRSLTTSTSGSTATTLKRTITCVRR